MWVDHKWTLYISRVGEVQLDFLFKLVKKIRQIRIFSFKIGMLDPVIK